MLQTISIHIKLLLKYIKINSSKGGKIVQTKFLKN
jgi:hypothetical protein